MKVKTLTIVGLFTALKCVISPFCVPLGIIPLSLASLGIYVIGALLDYKKAIFVILIYIALGAIGVPVFSNFRGGIDILIGPTGGYIFGYIFLIIFETIFIKIFKNKIWAYPVAMLIGTLILYVVGGSWFLIYFNLIKNTPYSFAQSIAICVIPFIPGDIIKISIASLIVIKLRKITRNYLYQSKKA